MTQNFTARNELDYLLHAAVLCREVRPAHDGVWQVVPYFCSIPFQDGCIARLESLKEKLRAQFPTLIGYGEKRAERAFQKHHDSITKPSYIKRIENFCGRGLNQVSNMKAIAQKEAYSSGLVFSVFDPEDLVRRQRPGYVPCLVAGSVLIDHGELHLNAFFRSQSILEMALFDLMFLRQFQAQLVDIFQAEDKRHEVLREGPLNIFCSRVFIHRRLVKRNKNFVKRADIVDGWISIVELATLEASLNSNDALH
jgi:hypothetical protein